MSQRLLVLFLTLSLLSAKAANGQDLLPGEIAIGQATYAVEYTKGDRGGQQAESRVPAEYRFADDEFEGILDKELRSYYGWDGRHFLRSPSGRWGLPMYGHAQFTGYIDARQKTFIKWEEKFPPLSEGYYQWVGFCRDEFEMPRSYFLYMSRWDSNLRKFNSYRVTVPFESPEEIELHSLKGHAIREVFHRRGKMVPALIQVESRGGWAILSATTGEIILKGSVEVDNDRISHLSISPDESQLFAIHWRGLHVYRTSDGQRLKQFDGVGRHANARTLGVQFDPSGKVASVAMPYEKQVTLIDVPSLTPIATYKTAQPIAGLQFDAETKKAFARVTELPYE